MQTPEKKKYKYDIVADTIIDEIRAGVWRVGDKLPSEAKLIERYAVSRVCLREALKKLSVIGILRIAQGDGTYVNEVIPSNVLKPFLPLLACKETYVEEIYNARIIVESGAAKLLAKVRTEQDVEDMALEIDEMRDALMLNDQDAFSLHDRNFHEIIIQRCGNPILSDIGKMFQDIALEYTKKLNTNEAVVSRALTEHQMVYWAIKEQREEQARVLLDLHLERSKVSFLEMIENNSSESGEE